MNVYRVDRSYVWNYRHGPSLEGPFPSVPETPLKDFLGLRVRSRIGIAAGILLNSRWIECYSRLGYDILTYKTVRSAPRPCYRLPNWVYVKTPRPGSRTARVLRSRPRETESVTSAVCFGMPSMAPGVWRSDVRRARRLLGHGQALIVSVVGTPDAEACGTGAAAALCDDFVRCARWARDAGAHAVEANLSCPNVDSAEGSVYEDLRLTRTLCALLRDALPGTPLLLKAGHFDSRERLTAFYSAVSGLVDAVVLVNGISMRVVNKDGRPAFPGHERVGVIGRGLQDSALSNVRQAASVERRRELGTRTVAVGGVLSVKDAALYFEAGAAAVLLGGGAALNPHLAGEMKALRPDW